MVEDSSALTRRFRAAISAARSCWEFICGNGFGGWDGPLCGASHDVRVGSRLSDNPSNQSAETPNVVQIVVSTSIDGTRPLKYLSTVGCGMLRLRAKAATDISPRNSFRRETNIVMILQSVLTVILHLVYTTRCL